MINIDKENEENQHSSINRESQEPIYVHADKPKYAKAFLFGSLAGVVIAAVLAAIGIFTGSEWWIALIVGVTIEAVIVHNFVPSRSASSAFIGAILCGGTYLLYQLIMAIFGYSYAEDADTTFWLMTIGSIIFGAYMGYKGDED